MKTYLAEAVARLESRLDGVRESAEQEAERNLARRPGGEMSRPDGAQA